MAVNGSAPAARVAGADGNLRPARIALAPGIVPGLGGRASDHDRRLELYRSGATDAAIANALGLKRNTVTVWRLSKGLPSVTGSHGRRLTKTLEAPRLLLYALGWGDHAIAKELAMGVRSIAEWRGRRKLPPNFAHGVNQSRNPRPTMADVFARVRRSMARYLPRDVADDAIGDLVEDVLNGTIPLAKIEAEAKRYGNRVLSRFANRYAARSLDEELGDEDGFRLIDLVRDDRSSSWLEEMGATAW